MPRGIPNTPRQAQHNPVIRSGALETEGKPIGYTERTTQEGAGEPVLVQVTDRMPDAEKAAMLAFMNEDITVRIATTTDKNADQVFEVTVNGRTELFRRGETKTVKRYFVDRLAHLKQTSYIQRDAVNDAGIKQKLMDPNTAIRYDFAVIRDANPMGEHWLKATLGMAG